MNYTLLRCRSSLSVSPRFLDVSAIGLSFNRFNWPLLMFVSMAFQRPLCRSIRCFCWEVEIALKACETALLVR